MLHDEKVVTNKDGSRTLSGSLFINRAELPNLAAVTVKAKEMPGGATPGPDAEVFVEVIFPKGVAKPVVKPAVPLTTAQAAAAKAEADKKAAADAAAKKDADAKAAAAKAPVAGKL